MNQDNENPATEVYSEPEKPDTAQAESSENQIESHKKSCFVKFREWLNKAKKKTGLPGREPIFLLILITFCLLIFSRIIDVYLTDRGNEYFVVAILQIIIFLIPALIYIRTRNAGYVKGLRLKMFRLDHIFLILAASLMLLCGNMLIGMIGDSFNSSTDSFTLYNTFISHNNGSVAGGIYLVIAYGILPAACEELIFRGMICAEFEKRCGVPCAVAISAFFFALLHFDPLQIPVYLFSGIVLCAVMYVTRSLFGAFAVHCIYNICCVFMQSSFIGFYHTANNTGLFTVILIIAFLLAAAVSTGEASRIYKHYARINASSEYAEVKIPWRKLPSVFFRSVYTYATVICIILYIVVIIFR